MCRATDQSPSKPHRVSLTAAAAHAGVLVASVVVTLASSTGRVGAQPTHDYVVYLPPTRGATVLSTYIDAQAHYILAMGDYLESAAIARRHRAEAVEQELENSLEWVETYFKRREVNRAYRLEEEPPYLDKAENQEKVTHRRIDRLPREVLEGDVTDELNWLLDRIATASLAYDAIYGSNELYVDSVVDQPLRPEDIRHIVLTDGGGKYGEKLTFRADDAKVLKERWPIAFRAPEFDSTRKSFETAVDKGLNEIQVQRQLSYPTWTEMRQAVGALDMQLERKYPKEYRKEAPVVECLIYHRAKRFLKLQELAIVRAMSTNQVEAFDGSNRFVGDSVFDLIRHLCRRGLNFAHPEAGDEATYEKLLIAMRHIYLQFYPEELAHW